MRRLKPEKLQVSFTRGTLPDSLVLPRRYTLTHSDRTGELFLTISSDFDKKQISGLYTRFMRDEVLAEIIRDVCSITLKVYCHISEGVIIGTAGFRCRIFHAELPLVLEAIRYGDRVLFETNPELDDTPVQIHFTSGNRKYAGVEHWGTMNRYV